VTDFPDDNSTTEMPPFDPVFSPAVAASEIGCLGKYRVLSRLGSGGMGAVYLGFDPLLQRKVALKVMLPRFAASASARERFLREARAVANVRSDHVVTIHDIGEEAGNPFFAMEFLQGRSLDDWLRSEGRPDIAQALRVVREVATGLAAAHAQGLVHRDIKPGNLWLEDPTRRVKILDFGLAKVPNPGTEADAEITKVGQTLGTPAYMSPEQARGGAIDHRTDLFSLGSVLYQLLTGRLPFPGATQFEILTRLAVDDPTPVRELNPAVHPRLAGFVHRLLEKDPADRPASATEVVTTLRAFDAPFRPPDPPTPPAVSTVPVVTRRPAEKVAAPPRGVAMPYSAQISRVNPACVLLLIDQSKSMAKPFPGAGQSKAEAVADAVNRLIQNLVLRSAKADGVRDYFRVGVIGYGKSIRAGLGGTLPADVLVPISQVSDHPLRVEARTKKIPDGAGGVIEQTVKFPVWFEPTADGNTPMCAAFVDAALTIKVFIEKFPNAFPPIVLNLTDGEPSDGNPQENARMIRTRSTSDGNVLLFNLLLSSEPLQPRHFPENESYFADTDNLSKLLFRMSSELPPPLWNAARAEGFDVQPNARGVVINADPTALVRFLDIGTRVNPVAGR
jgi:serine/threonine protein kinase